MVVARLLPLRVALWVFRPPAASLTYVVASTAASVATLALLASVASIANIAEPAAATFAPEHVAVVAATVVETASCWELGRGSCFFRFRLD